MNLQYSNLQRLATCCALIISLLLSTERMFGQCAPNEIEVQFVFTTDAWGYEVYWELYEEGETCGNNPIVSGGNAEQVGCNGGGEQEATNGNGYPNNATIELDPICLQQGLPLVFHYIDDWGDGGFNVQVFEEGNFIVQWNGTGQGNQWIYTPGAIEFPDHNQPCLAAELLIDGPVITLFNTDAGILPGEPSPPGGSCQQQGLWCEGSLQNSAWAAFVAPEDGGSIELTTCHAQTNFDTKFALWKADNCNDFSTYTLISSNDDAPGGCGSGNGFASRMYAGCLEPGETYLVQVDGYQGQTGTFGLSATTFSPGVSLNANVNSMDCAVNKGEPGEGSIALNMTGYGSNFTVEWEGSNGFTASTSTINNLDAGTYTATVTTACGPPLTQTYEITMPQPLFMTLSLEQPQCPGSADGAASVNVFGGTPPFSYLWQGPENYTSLLANPTNLSEGAYTVDLTDANGCETSLNFTLLSSGELEVDLGPNQVICTDENLLLFAPPGYDYEWQDGGINQFYYVEGEMVGEGEHTFIVTVTNAEGCIGLDAVTVIVENCTSVDNLNTEQPAIYPNPAQSYVYVGHPGGQPVEVTVFSATGQRVFGPEMHAGNAQFSVEEWAKGLYLFTLRVDDRQHVHRIMVK